MKNANFLQKNKEIVVIPPDPENFKLKLRERNSARHQDAQRNRRLRELEDLENRKFLSEKYDLLKSVTYLQRVHEQNQFQMLMKQRTWLQILTLAKFCSLASELLKVS